jgi:ABC-2 type transport system permease protein
MKKLLSIFRISFAQEFAYRLNFIMWRVRNVMQILLLFFLWTSVFPNTQRMLFGYDRVRILTYVFGIMVVRAIVFSARAVDVSGEIANGDLTNLLLKPVSYFKYWLTRDLSSKALNLAFAAVETGILFFILKPDIFLQTNLVSLLAFGLSLAIAILVFFSILMLINFVAFWAPEMGWASQFLFVVVITEFLSGALFPLDILPRAIQNFLFLTPFPYLIFVPIQIYLGKISGAVMLKGIIVSGIWLVVLLTLLKWVWRRGLLVYRAEGR